MNEKIEIHVMSIVGTPANDKIFAAILGDKEERRYFPIIVSGTEAQAIITAMQHVMLPRPTVYDIFTSFIRESGHNLEETVIYKADNGIFSAWLCFDNDLRIDAKASDAIALALRMRSLIYVYENILNENDMARHMAERKHTPEEDMQALQKKLDKAVKNENFELAIKLRDIIKELTSKKNNDKKDNPEE